MRATVSVVEKAFQVSGLDRGEYLKVVLSRSYDFTFKLQQSVYIVVGAIALKIRQRALRLSVASEIKLAQFVQEIVDDSDPGRDDAGPKRTSPIACDGLRNVSFGV